MMRRFALVSLIALSCSTKSAPFVPSQANVSTDLAPVSGIQGEFLLRQQLVFRYTGGQGSFEAILQKHCTELTVVGLTPFGTRAFTLTQNDRGVHAQVSSPQIWPFPPEYLLEDVHRVLITPLSEGRMGDGVYERSHGSERIWEHWLDGQLTRREVQPKGGSHAWKVVIHFPDPSPRYWPPTVVRLENDLWGYELEITTLSRRELSCP